MAKERDGEWAEAKRRCRLSADDVKMAKALGLQPWSLIRNIPDPREAWKAPVRDWVRDLYRKRFGTVIRAEQRPSPRLEPPAEPPVADCGEEPWLLTLAHLRQLGRISERFPEGRASFGVKM